jgi:hypothetical protein
MYCAEVSALLHRLGRAAGPGDLEPCESVVGLLSLYQPSVKLPPI